MQEARPVSLNEFAQEMHKSAGRMAVAFTGTTHCAKAQDLAERFKEDLATLDTRIWSQVTDTAPHIRASALSAAAHPLLAQLTLLALNGANCVSADFEFNQALLAFVPTNTDDELKALRRQTPVDEEAFIAWASAKFTAMLKATATLSQAVATAREKAQTESAQMRNLGVAIGQAASGQQRPAQSRAAPAASVAASYGGPESRAPPARDHDLLSEIQRITRRPDSGLCCSYNLRAHGFPVRDNAKVICEGRGHGPDARCPIKGVTNGHRLLTLADVHPDLRNRLSARLLPDFKTPPGVQG